MAPQGGHRREDRGNARAFEPRARVSKLASAGLAALLSLSCAALEPYTTAGEHAGHCLALDEAVGAERLRIESEHDANVRAWIAREGRPDYLYVLDRHTFYLFHPRRDRVAVVHRGLIGASELRGHEPIPGSLLEVLPRAEMDAVLARRARAQRRARAARPRSAPQPAPAAPAPAVDFGVRRFDVAAIVERLRRPMTAADPGVSEWQRGLMPDGSLRRTGLAGGTRYEVRSDAVTTAAAIGSSSERAPAGVRLAIARVNAAVFGVRADAINHVAHPLADRVIRDASGRSALARRLAGRTIHVSRSPDRRLLVYSVHAR